MEEFRNIEDFTEEQLEKFYKKIGSNYQNNTKYQYLRTNINNNIS